MKQTILSILTNPEARTTSTIEQGVSQEYSAGQPWFDAAEQ